MHILLFTKITATERNKTREQNTLNKSYNGSVLLLLKTNNMTWSYHPIDMIGNYGHTNHLSLSPDSNPLSCEERWFAPLHTILQPLVALILFQKEIYRGNVPNDLSDQHLKEFLVTVHGVELLYGATHN